MKGRSFAVAALALLAAQPLAAQANSCPPGTVNSFGIPDRQRATQDACQIAVDVFQLVAPQLGLALAGGNATLGQGGTLGGLGHFAVGVRGNVFTGDLPEFDTYNVSTGGRQQRELETGSQILGLPTVDAAIGVFKGLPLGLTNVGGVDVLLSASYVPTIGQEGDDFRITPESNLKLGFGARLGLLQETLLVPGVSVTYLKRDLPTTDILGQSSDLEVTIRDASVETTAWRLVASKSLLMFGLAAGVGQDEYSQSAKVRGTVRTSPIGQQQSDEVTLAQDLTRTNFFLDASFNLPFFKIVGEIGHATGGSLPAGVPYNTFSGGEVTKARTYGSLGLRFGF